MRNIVRDGLRYASDMTQAEWLLLGFFLPRPCLRGRPREVDLRAVRNAILSIPWTGSPWRAVKGRKRHIVTDTQGFLLAVQIHRADIQDSHGAVPLRGLLRNTFPKLQHIFADRVYRGPKLRNAIAAFGKWDIEIVTRSERAGEFKPEPRRWIVERTFAWLSRCRRLYDLWGRMARKRVSLSLPC